MRIGGSLLLIAIGAILKWAITADVSGVNLDVIGIILMIIGAVGFVISLVLMASRRRSDVIHRGVAADGRPVEQRTTYVTPGHTDDEV